MYLSKYELCNFGQMQMPQPRPAEAGLTLGLGLARWCGCDFLGVRAARRTLVGQLSLGVL